MYTEIKTYEDACKALGIPTDIKIDVSQLSDSEEDSEQKYFIAQYKLMIIAKAINEGWKPNWDDTTERKWYPFFDMRSGVGFSDSYYGYRAPGTICGSRLCFQTKEMADYAGKQFLDIYRDALK